MYIYVPLNKPRTSEAVEHKSCGKLGPMMNDGRIVTKSIPFSLQYSQAAFSAIIFDIGYHALIRYIYVTISSIITNTSLYSVYI